MADKPSKPHLSGDYKANFSKTSCIPTVFEVVGDAVQPFLPFFNTVTIVVKSLLTAYENAKCNHKICLALIDRVEIAQQAVNSLQRERSANEKLFRDQAYYNSWVRFITVLENIKRFCKEITQLSTLQKYIHATAVQEAFDKNIKEFEEVCGTLHFTLAIYDHKRRETEAQKINEDIEILKNSMNEIGSALMKELTLLNAKMTELMKSETKGSDIQPNCKLSEVYDIRKIESEHIKIYPGTGKYIKKGSFKGIDVACKKISTINDDSIMEFQIERTELAILSKLGNCPHIIGFHGLFTIENMIIFDWAQNGNLKKLYEYNTIDWNTKLKIARDICKGLVFIHGCNILHHDIRCENILITEAFEPKISNFELSRGENEISKELKNILDIVRWLAPEKMYDPRYQMTFEKKRNNSEHKPAKSYDNMCEMFSFGMLLWELCHQRIPYKNMNSVIEIQHHVMSKKRESMEMLLCPQQIPNELAKIIKRAWDDQPSQRPKIMEVLTTLKDLVEKHVPQGTSPKIIPKNTSDNDVSKFSLLPAMSHQRTSSTPSVSESTFSLPEDPSKFTLDNIPAIPAIPAIQVLVPFEEGDKAHKAKNYKFAWECFSGHADSGNNRAKYWKGYYLLNGYHVKKDLNAALEFFKDAANNGVVEAQLRYAFLLLETGSTNFSEILDYIEKAANTGNEIALYNLGDIYLNGKLGVQTDKVRAKGYIVLSALKNNSKAIKLLESFKTSDDHDDCVMG